MADNKAAQDKDAAGPSEIEVLMKSVVAQPGVEGFMVFNDAAVPLKWTAAFVKPGNPSNPTPIPASVVHHAAVIGELCSRARATAARVLGDGEGEVQLMRLRTKYHELLIAPSQECTLVVSQRAHSAVFEPLVRLSARSQA